VESNCVIKRYRANNVTIPDIVTETNAYVDITVPADPRVTVDAVGICVPVDADFTDGVGILPCRMTTNTNLRLGFVNASAGNIDPDNTFDFDIILILSTGANATEIP
jgi:hypothetical protein